MHTSSSHPSSIRPVDPGVCTLSLGWVVRARMPIRSYMHAKSARITHPRFGNNAQGESVAAQVAEHYNARPDVGVHARQESPIINLKVCMCAYPEGVGARACAIVCWCDGASMCVGGARMHNLSRACACSR